MGRCAIRLEVVNSEGGGGKAKPGGGGWRKVERGRGGRVERAGWV